jgi:flagellar FliJ protein
MSNDRSIEPLMALLGQAERERDAAMAESRRAIDAQAAATAQAEQLTTYRGEYEARFREQFSRSCSMDVMQHYQGFMQRLTMAIDQQQRVVVHAQGRVERLLQLLREQEMRVASVRKLLERRLQELRLVADRREQKQTDEFAARAAWSRLSQATASPAA